MAQDMDQDAGWMQSLRWNRVWVRSSGPRLDRCCQPHHLPNAGILALEELCVESMCGCGIELTVALIQLKPHPDMVSILFLWVAPRSIDQHHRTERVERELEL
eukprot:scaffold19466_cov129-Isochrysis_galbana.AAC.5